MAHISSKDIGVFMAGGYDLLGFSTMVGVGEEVGTEQVDPLGSDWVYFGSTGIHTVSISQNGFYTTGTAGSNEAFSTTLSNGVAVPMIIGMGGGVTLGSPMWLAHSPIQSGFDISASRGEMVKANATYVGGGRLQLGKLIGYDDTTGNTTHTGAAVNNTASTAFGCYAILQVPTYVPDGATGLVFKLQGSANGTTGWTDLITFPTVTDDHAFALAHLTSGTVHQYLRVLATWSGTPGALADAAFAVAVYRKTS